MRIAIVGFSEKTLPYLAKDGYGCDEMWTLNHAWLVVGKSIPRIDRLFEIHKEDWFVRKEIPKSLEYWAWLQKPQDFPIYMQDIHPQVPASIKYPIDAVSDDLFKHLIRKVGEEEVHDKYFTSTASFMLAMAIHTLSHTNHNGAPHRIELYGVDMESDTEYGYQKPGGEYMIGLANGRDIDVVRPEPSELCRSPIYGYDVVPYVDRNRLVEIHNMYKDEYALTNPAFMEAAQALNDNPNDDALKQKYFDSSGLDYTLQGAILLIENILLDSDKYISRQIIEMKRTSWMNNAEWWKGMVNRTRVEFTTLFNGGKGDPQQYNPKWNEYQNCRAEMFGATGAVQVLSKLMGLIDFRPVDFKLDVIIKEE